MTSEKEVTEKVAHIIDQSVGDKKARRRPKTTCPPPGSGTSHQFMILIQGYAKNTPLSGPIFGLSAMKKIYFSYFTSLIRIFVRNSCLKLSITKECQRFPGGRLYNRIDSQ